jgi:DHA2 family multidrug resistance protein
MTAAHPDGTHRGLVTLSVMLATIMQALDTTIANVALPHMQGSMGATQDQISWVLTSYIVAAAIFMPLTGFLTARLGRKRIFMWAVVGFTIASMLCGACVSSCAQSECCPSCDCQRRATTSSASRVSPNSLPCAVNP